MSEVIRKFLILPTFFFGGNTMKKVKNIIKRDWGSWILLLPSLFLFIFMVWQPLISTIRLSFYETKGFEAVKFIGLENYKAVLSNSGFIKTLQNTFLYVFWSLVIGYFVPIIVAVFLNEMVHMKSVFRFCFYFPVMIPSMAASLLWTFIFDPGEGGIMNKILMFFGASPCQWLQNSSMTIPLIIVTMTWRSFGSTMLIYLASLQGINRELYEAAGMDGASFFQKIRYIQFPALKNLMGLMLIKQIIGVFQIMQEPLAMTGGGPNNASMSLMLSSYNYGFTYFQIGRSTAVGTITFLILAVFTVVYQLMSRKGGEA